MKVIIPALLLVLGASAVSAADIEEYCSETMKTIDDCKDTCWEYFPNGGFTGKVLYDAVSVTKCSCNLTNPVNQTGTTSYLCTRPPADDGANTTTTTTTSTTFASTTASASTTAANSTESPTISTEPTNTTDTTDTTTNSTTFG